MFWRKLPPLTTVMLVSQGRWCLFSLWWWWWCPKGGGGFFNCDDGVLWESVSFLCDNSVLGIVLASSLGFWLLRGNSGNSSPISTHQSYCAVSMISTTQLLSATTVLVTPRTCVGRWLNRHLVLLGFTSLLLEDAAYAFQIEGLKQPCIEQVYQCHLFQQHLFPSCPCITFR